MSDEISRRPRSTQAAFTREQPRYESRSRSTGLLRAIAQLCVMAIFLAGGYYGADMFLTLLDNKNIVTQENVVSNTAELQRLLEADQSDRDAVAPRKQLAVYHLSTDGLVKSSLRVLADVQEDQILQAVKSVFAESSEGWANVIVPKHVYRDGVTAYIDLPRDFATGLGTLSEQRALLLLTGLVRTIVENFPPVKQVYFLADGRWVNNVGGIHLSDPWGFSESDT